MSNSFTQQLSGRKAGTAIFKEALAALGKDKSVLWIPIYGILTNVVILGFGLVAWILLIPVMDIYKATNVVDSVLGVVLYLLFASVHVFVQASVMSAADTRLSGGNAKLSSSIGAAFKSSGRLFVFALVEGTVGLLLRVIRDNVKVIGSILSFFGGLAWGIASYFAIPSILFANAGPFDAIGKSTTIVRNTWGSALKANVVAGGVIVLAWLVSLGTFVGGIVLMVKQDSTSSAIFRTGLAVTAVGLVLVLLVALLQSTVMAYVRVALYRFANKQQLSGFDSANLGSAFSAGKPLLS